MEKEKVLYLLAKDAHGHVITISGDESSKQGLLLNNREYLESKEGKAEELALVETQYQEIVSVKPVLIFAEKGYEHLSDNLETLFNACHKYKCDFNKNRIELHYSLKAYAILLAQAER